MRRHNWGVGEVRFLYFQPVAELSTPTVILLFCLYDILCPSFYVHLFYWRLFIKKIILLEVAAKKIILLEVQSIYAL